MKYLVSFNGPIFLMTLCLFVLESHEAVLENKFKGNISSGKCRPKLVSRNDHVCLLYL